MSFASPQTTFVAVDGRISPSLVEPLSQVDSKPQPTNSIQPDHQSKQLSQDSQYSSTHTPLEAYPIQISPVFNGFESTETIGDKAEVDQEICQTYPHWASERQSCLYPSALNRSISSYNNHGTDHSTYIPLDDSSESDPFADEDQPGLHVSISDDRESNDSEDDSSQDSFILIDPSSQIPTLRVFDNNGPLDKLSGSTDYTFSGRQGCGVPLFWEGADMGYDLTDYA
jgi:hypothetical protein